MKKIEEIKLKKREVVIVINGKSYPLSKESFTDGYYYVNKEIDDEEFKRIENDSKKKNIDIYLMTLFTKNRYTCFEIKKKLKDKFDLSEQKIDEIIYKYIESNTLDDYSYTCDFIRFKQEKNYGKQAILNDLKRKGISEDILQDKKIQALFTYEYDFNLTLKKIDKSYLPYMRRKNNLIQFLLRRGFSYSQSNQYVEDYLSSCDEENNEEQKIIFLRKEAHKCYNHIAKKDYSEKEKNDYIISHLLRKGYSRDEISIVLKESEND